MGGRVSERPAPRYKLPKPCLGSNKLQPGGNSASLEGSGAAVTAEEANSLRGSSRQLAQAQA